MPGIYNDYDPEKEAKLAQQRKNFRAQEKKDNKKLANGLKSIKEVEEEEAAAEAQATKIDDKIWGLYEEEDTHR